MGQMALGAGGAHAMIIVAAMDIGIMGTFKQFHAVAADAKLSVGGSGYPLIGDKPAKKWQEYKGHKTANNHEQHNLSFS